MTFDVLLVAPYPLAVFSAWCAYRFAVRENRASETRMRNASAASDLAQPLRDLQALLRRHGRVPITQGDVAAAVDRWGIAWDRQQHRLPRDLSHVQRSVHGAIGTVFGAVAMTHIRPEHADYPLAAPDFMWQDFADDYIDYVLDGILRWGDSQRGVKIERFDPWLVKTGRRDPLGLDGSR